MHHVWYRFLIRTGACGQCDGCGLHDLDRITKSIAPSPRAPLGNMGKSMSISRPGGEQGAGPGSALGPVQAGGIATAGWATDLARATPPTLSADGTLTITGDSRLYLVSDHQGRSWADHRYVRYDLSAEPLEFVADLSGVPCGCLACVSGHIWCTPTPCTSHAVHC